jgi:hypothetical protein
MTSTLETTKSTLWPQSSVPSAPGTAWQWEITTLRQLSGLRTDLRTRLRSVGCDDATGGDVTDDGDPVSDRILLAVEELASNGLRHGVDPVHVQVVATADGWLIDVSDGATEQRPHPAFGRDPARGGMGLHLVAELTGSQGWAVVDGRKHVWAFLPLGMSDRIPRAPWQGRGGDQPGPHGPEDVAEGDAQLTSWKGHGPGAPPTPGAPADSTRQPSRCPPGKERQSSDSVPVPLPSGAGRWAALTQALSPQRRALANARRAVDRDQRAAAQREEAGRALLAAAGTRMAQAVAQ